MLKDILKYNGMFIYTVEAFIYLLYVHSHCILLTLSFLSQYAQLNIPMYVAQVCNICMIIVYVQRMFDVSFI